jgi:hypothetical protein
MSNKVLKLAGRRPMLLALFIMATLTLGLLFSGWLTPTSGKAQGTGGPNPPPNIENTNCPNFTYTTNASCPTITNGEVLAPLTFCVVRGDPLPDPNWATPPGATTGRVIIITTESCSNIVTSTTNPITYGFSWHYQTPPGKPSTPTTAGIYTATAIGVITSSDINDCPNPAAPTWNVTWNVIRKSLELTGNPYNWVPDWVANLVDLGGKVINSPVTLGAIAGSDIYGYEKYCCLNNVASVSYDNKSINASKQAISIEIGTTSIGAMVDTMIGNGLKLAGVGALTSATTTAIDSFVDPIVASLSAGGLKANASANFNNVVGYNDTCVCASPDGWYGTDAVSFGCTVGVIDVPKSVLQPFGLDIPISIVALSANLDYTKQGLILYSGPATTAFNNMVTTSRKSDIYTKITVGLLYDQTHHWSGPTDVTTTNNYPVCCGHDYPK